MLGQSGGHQASRTEGQLVGQLCGIKEAATSERPAGAVQRSRGLEVTGQGQKVREHPAEPGFGLPTFSRGRDSRWRPAPPHTRPPGSAEGAWGWAGGWGGRAGERVQWSWTCAKCAQIPDTQNSPGHGTWRQEALVQHLGSWCLQARDKEPLLTVSTAAFRTGTERVQGWDQSSVGCVGLSMLFPSSVPQCPGLSHT